MAFYQIQHFSKVLGMNMPFSVILPDEIAEEKIKTLYLLHGKGDNHLSWALNSKAKNYAYKHNLALIMPSAQLSFYTDMDKGFDFFKYVALEIPRVAERMFPCIAGDREKRFVAGLSMGGYGALKLALSHPEMFSRAFCFSSVIDLKRRINSQKPELKRFFKCVFGEGVQPEDDLFSLAENFKDAVKPSIYMSCGRNDGFIIENRELIQILKANCFDVSYYEEEGIGHSWDFWDSELKKTCDYIGGID